MATTTTITAIRATHCGEFITHKVLAACTTMSTAAKYPDLVYEIAFFQNAIFVWVPVSIIQIACMCRQGVYSSLYTGPKPSFANISFQTGKPW